MEHLRRQIVTTLLAFGLAVVPLASQPPPAPQTVSDPKMDYSSARREIQGFEDILDSVINTTFNAAPFALSQRAKGAYLPGYGMMFSFVVNINRAMINTPFGQKRGDPTTPEQKKQKIEELKEKLLQTLFTRGDGLHQVPKEEAVTIVSYIEDRSFPGEESLSRTIILTMPRKDLDELARKEDRRREFKQRAKIVEY